MEMDETLFNFERLDAYKEARNLVKEYMSYSVSSPKRKPMHLSTLQKIDNL